MLSAREKEILTLIAEGKANKEIGLSLCISPATVRNHVSNIMDKLEVRDRTEAVVVALYSHWIKPNYQPKANLVNTR